MKFNLPLVKTGDGDQGSAFLTQIDTNVPSPAQPAIFSERKPKKRKPKLKAKPKTVEEQRKKPNVRTIVRE